MARGNWTPVPNEVFDLLMKELTGSEFKVLLLLIRLTEGFHKKRDQVTNLELAERAGLDRRRIAEILTSLQNKNLISKNSRGYSVIYAQNVAKSDSLNSEFLNVAKSDSNVAKSDSQSRKMRHLNQVQNVAKSDTPKKHHLKETFKETPPTREAGNKSPAPGWEQAVEALVVVGVDFPLAVELCEIAESRGRDRRYILDITGYVALPSTGANNPAAMAISLIRANDERSSKRPLDAPGRPLMPVKEHSGAIDWTAPKYQHGGSAHFLMKSNCPICKKNLEESRNFLEGGD